MTEENAPEWGAPESRPAQRAPWTAKKTIAAVAIAVGITAAGGVAIYAASGTNQQSQGAGGPGGMGGAPPNGGGMRGNGSAFGSVAHGEFQNGEVTSISDSSLEVKSTDGYTKTYVIDADTVIQSVQKGDTVMVIAATEDGKTVASSVVEPGQRGQGQAPPTR